MASSPTKKTLEQRTQDLRIQKIVEDSQHSQIDSVYNESYKFKIGVRGFERCKLSMKNDGSYLIQLREIERRASQVSGDTEHDSPAKLMPEKALSPIKYNVLFKVRTLYGRTKIILSSPLQIENNSKVDLVVLIELNERVAHWKDTLKNELQRYEEIKLAGFGPSGNETRQFAIIFELLADKIYYVPLIVAYNFKIFITPNVAKYQPSLVFDIRGYNLRIDDPTEVCCAKIAKVGSTQPIQADVSAPEQKDNDESAFDNDFFLMKQLSLNVKSHKNVMPAMHANYKVL